VRDGSCLVHHPGREEEGARGKNDYERVRGVSASDLTRCSPGMRERERERERETEREREEEVNVDPFIGHGTSLSSTSAGQRIT